MVGLFARQMIEHQRQSAIDILSRAVTLKTVETFCAAAIDYTKGLIEEVSAEPPIRLHRLALALHCTVPGYAGLVSRRLHHNDETAAPDRLDILVVSPESGLIGRPPVWGEVYFNARALESTLAQTRYRATFLHDSRCWQIQDMVSGIGLQWMLDDAALPPWDAGAPLRTFLHWTYGAMGMRLAHAGTLGLGGIGVLLTGKGGSGKSGTVCGGIMDGFESVGDDYVLIEMTDEGVMAHALFPSLKQDPAGVSRLGLGEMIGARQPNWQGKLEFESTDIGGRELVNRLLIKAVLVASLGEGEATSVEILSKARAMVSLAPTGLFQMPADRDAAAAFYADIIRKLPTRSIALGTDRHGVNAAIVDVLREFST